MGQEIEQAASPTAVRVAGTIVVLATLSTVVLTTLFFLKPWMFLQPWMFPPGHPGAFLGTGLFGSLIVSGVGALLMLAVTRRWLWIFGLMTVAATVALFLLLGATMGPLMH